MLEPPWLDSTGEIRNHWAIWLIGWAWSVSGIVLGALVAPTLAQQLGLTNSGYQDMFVMAIAVIAGFLVQFLGWCMMGLLAAVLDNAVKRYPQWLDDSIGWVFALVPLAGVGYGIYRYVTWVGAGQRTATVAFIGGLLIKTLVLLVITSHVTDTLSKWFMGRIRGDKPKSV
jgi:hypothetical protein